MIELDFVQPIIFHALPSNTGSGFNGNSASEVVRTKTNKGRLQGNELDHTFQKVEGEVEL
jgi:hypothetical protein